MIRSAASYQPLLSMRRSAASRKATQTASASTSMTLTTPSCFLWMPGCGRRICQNHISSAGSWITPILYSQESRPLGAIPYAVSGKQYNYRSFVANFTTTYIFKRKRFFPSQKGRFRLISLVSLSNSPALQCPSILSKTTCVIYLMFFG